MSLLQLFGSVFAAATLGTIPGVPGDYTPDTAHAIFVDSGYEVSPITTWDWTASPVSVFTVQDRQRGRMLMVEVCADVRAAQFSERPVPAGFTSSTWIYNVVLFEATEQDYKSLTTAAQESATGMVDEVQTASLTSGLVDQQYTELLVWGASAH